MLLFQLHVVVMAPNGHVGNNDLVAGLSPLATLQAIVGRTPKNGVHAARFVAILRNLEGASGGPSDCSFGQ
jgi:hypothetical protein